MSPVPRKLHHLHARIARLDIEQHRERAVFAAIVDVEDLGGLVHSVKRPGDFIVQLNDDLLLVVDRDDDRNHES